MSKWVINWLHPKVRNPFKHVMYCSLTSLKEIQECQAVQKSVKLDQWNASNDRGQVQTTKTNNVFESLIHILSDCDTQSLVHWYLLNM